MKKSSIRWLPRWSRTQSNEHFSDGVGSISNNRNVGLIRSISPINELVETSGTDAERVGKVMVTVFSESHGVVLKWIKAKQSSGFIRAIEDQTAKINIICHDNVSSHTLSVVAAKLQEFRFELLPHSPDLAPRDYFLFANLNKWLKIKKVLVTKFEKSFYIEKIKKL